MMPDRGPSAKKFKPTDLPKPAQNSAKILAQLKNCPFGVNVYQSKNKKLPITEKEFTEIMAVINQKWLEQSGFGENLRIEGMIFNFLNLSKSIRFSALNGLYACRKLCLSIFN